MYIFLPKEISNEKSEITTSRKSKWLHSNNHELVLAEGD
jgi:hypothetical protein